MVGKMILVLIIITVVYALVGFVLLTIKRKKYSKSNSDLRVTFDFLLLFYIILLVGYVLCCM